MSRRQADPTTAPRGDFCHRTRREFLWEAGAGFTGVALSGLLSGEGFFGGKARGEEGGTTGEFANPLAPKAPHFTPRAEYFGLDRALLEAMT